MVGMNAMTPCMLKGETVKCSVLLKTFSLPTDAHNVKKHRVIKTF